MPNVGNMMFARPIHCRYCGNGFYALQHMVEYAQQKGKWNIIDLQAEQANKEPIYAALDEYDPLGFYAFGHGNINVYTGDMELPIFTSSECNKLQNRICFFLSCLTANELGPAIIAAGGKSYAGFNISWTWMMITGTDGDPYDDMVGKGFFESANELWKALVDNSLFGDACQQSRDKYTQWIDYWYEAGGPYAASAIRWLLHDRDGLVGLGDMNSRLSPCNTMLTKEDCEDIGCFWYNDVCQGELPLNVAYTKNIIVQTTETYAQHSNVAYPAEVYEQFNYEVSYDVTNTGGDGILYGQIRDNDTNQIIPDTYWEKELRNTQSIHISNTLYSIMKDMHLQIEVGHL